MASGSKKRPIVLSDNEELLLSDIPCKRNQVILDEYNRKREQDFALLRTPVRVPPHCPPNCVFNIGQSRYGQVLVMANIVTGVVSIDHPHVQGTFTIPKQVPRQLPSLPNDLRSIVNEYAGDTSQDRAEMFWLTQEEQGSDDAPLRIPFEGKISGDLRAPKRELEHWAEQQAALRHPVRDPLPDTVEVDVSTGESMLNSGAALDFWLHFTLPTAALTHLRSQ